MEYEDILAGMQETYRDLTGFDADSASDIGIRLRVLAEQLELLHRRAEELERQSFPQTSTGEALERHAACRGLYRKPARRAEGMLRFTREQPALQDIPIDAGILCATRPDPALQFETVEDGVLPTGETRVEVAARAVEPGEAGNVAGGAVCLMVSAPGGISGVTSPLPFSGGVDEEPDSALRARLLEAYRNISNGTNAAFYYDLAMKSESVLSASVIPRARGRGTVDVVIRCAADETEAVAALQEELEGAKEVNVDVLVRAAKVQSVNLSVAVSPAEGYGFDEVKATCEEALKAYLADLAVGEPLLPARLTAELLREESVYNLAVKSPDRDIHPAADTVLTLGAAAVERLVSG